MRAPYDDLDADRLLEQARALLGIGDDALLAEARAVIDAALRVRPDHVDGWLLRCQVLSAGGDDLGALAAAEMARTRAPERAACHYWCGAVLGDLGRPHEALAAIERALAATGDAEAWLLEELHFERVSLLATLGRAAEAVAACEAGLAACPGSALLRDALAPMLRARVRATLRVLEGGA